MGLFSQFWPQRLFPGWRFAGMAVVAGVFGWSLAGTPARATPVTRVLWYTYSAADSEYRDGIQLVADNARLLPPAPITAGPAWSLDWFEPDDVPDFTGYDVLVVHGGEKWRTDNACQTFECLPSPDFTGILANRDGIASARGNRTVISGSDADFHTVRGDNRGSLTDFSNPDDYDSPLGYLVNSINWAAAGDGLGIVSWFHGEHDGAFWWDHPESFLIDELAGFFRNDPNDDSPYIPPGMADHPLNLGLTSAGLSNWIRSFHGTFALDIPGYFPTVLDDAANPQWAVSIAADTRLLAVAEPPATAATVMTGLVLLLFAHRTATATQVAQRR